MNKANKKKAYQSPTTRISNYLLVSNILAGSVSSSSDNEGLHHRSGSSAKDNNFDMDYDDDNSTTLFKLDKKYKL